jgi:hypothetical protein
VCIVSQTFSRKIFTYLTVIFTFYYRYEYIIIENSLDIEIALINSYAN